MAKHIYVHIPFCARKCPYCAFFSIKPNGNNQIDKYFAALQNEIKTFAECAFPDANTDADESVDTIYFGGGTPSFVNSKYICQTLEQIKTAFSISTAEVTIEVNPISVDMDKLLMYRQAGFNRISIGVQSLHDDCLLLLGRLHNSKQALEAIANARKAGFENISSDLITGVPSQSVASLIEDADELILAGAKHISMYSLSIEEGTEFFAKYNDKLEDYVSPELEREMYHSLRYHLASKGLLPYEISNSGIEGYESRHNTSYWKGDEYYAFGPGSCGYLKGVRFGHCEGVDSYIASASSITISEIKSFFSSIAESNSLLVEEERMSNEAKLKEYAMLSLRMSKGINVERINSKYNIDFESLYKDALKRNISKGFLTCDGESYFLTELGLDFANQVFQDFI